MKTFELTFTQMIAMLLTGDAYQGRIDAMTDAAEEDAYRKFQKELDVLEDIAIKAGADPMEVNKAMIHIDDSFDCTGVGSALYYQGLVDALKLMGQSISMDELRKCMKEIRERGDISA